MSLALIEKDEVRRAYARDGSMYQILPQAVFRPRSTQDIVDAVAWAQEQGVPLHARGAASGRAGGAIGPGVVIDFKHAMNAITGDHAQPGAVRNDVNDVLARDGRFFAPDPSSGAFCTIGGMVGNNASGPHTLKYGSTRTNVHALEVVLADGSVVRTDNAPDLAARIRAIIAPHASWIDDEVPAVEKCSTGYDLSGAWNGGDVDLTRLFCGSEGTLGIVTSAWLKTAPLPAVTATVVVCFAELTDALAAVPAIKAHDVAACEVMDEVLLKLVREFDASAAAPVPEETQSILIVEIEGASEADVSSSVRALRADMERQAAFVAFLSALDDDQRARLWRIRKASSPILDRLEGVEVLHAVEDVVVPIEMLPEYVRGQRAIFRELGLPAAFFGHAGNGNLHLDPWCDTSRSDLLDVLQSMMESTYRWVIECGGAISGEHGDGIVRTPYLARQYPRSLAVFREIKAALDPSGIFNPGKIAVVDDVIAPDLSRLRWKEKALAPPPPWTALRH